MGDKIKTFLCSPDALFGRFAWWLAEAGKSTEIAIDVSDTDELLIFCWCCVLWRGLLSGLTAGAVLGFLAGVCL